MQGCTLLKRIMLCQIKFGLLFKISNYCSCVFISRQCTAVEFSFCAFLCKIAHTDKALIMIILMLLFFFCFSTP